MFFNYFKWGLLWSLFILIICLLPGNNLPKNTFLEDIYFDKIIHVFLYMVLFILVFLGANKMTKHSFFVAFIYSFFYGVLVELIQHYLIEDRYGDINDVFANFVGVIFGIIFVKIKKKYKTIEPLDNLGL